MKISPPAGLPKEVTVVGLPYTISYYDNPCEVGPSLDASYNGYVDHSKLEIRLWGAGRPIEAVIATLFHEVLHGIVEKMSLVFSEEGETPDYHPNFAALANGISDTMIRNNLLNPALLKSRDEASRLSKRPGRVT